ncbi:MAG: hypothetical protein ABJA78_12795 [Ferruginibacter sp.]
MAFEYFPSAAEEKTREVPRPNWLILVTVCLFIGLTLAVSYIIWDKNHTIQLLQQNIAAPVVNNPAPVVTAARDSLQKQLTEVTSRYAVLKTMSSQVNGNAGMRDSAIAARSVYIKQLLGKVNAGNKEIMEARQLIAGLNTDIENFKTEIETLKGEKIVLIQEKQTAGQQVTLAKKNYDSALTVIRQKNDIIDIATTLNAADFSITSIHEKNNGGEISTLVAKRVDKLRISFELGENRVAGSGTKELFICITGPDGTPISVEALGSGKFVTRNGEEKFYTQKVEVNYVEGNRQTVSFDWRQNSVFETGTYKIEVYNNGFKIGEGIRVLKKAGMFN